MMRFVVLALLLSVSTPALAQSAHCDARHVEVFGRCCAPGQTVANGRCTLGSGPYGWDTRWGLVGGGIAMLLGGYVTGVIGGLFGDAPGIWDDVAYPPCPRYVAYSFVPFLHQATLLDGYCYDRRYGFGPMEFFALFGTAGEIAGLAMIVLGLVGRRPPARARRASVTPWVGPSIVGVAISGPF